MATQHTFKSKLMSDLVHLYWILVENFISMFNTRNVSVLQDLWEVREMQGTEDFS